MARWGKARQAVDDALNGDRDKIDPAVRRALFAAATEMDEHAEAMLAAHNEILTEIHASVAKLEKQIAKVQALLVTTAITFVIALGTGLINVLLR